MTGVIDSGEPCSKNVKVSESHVQGTSNSTFSSNKCKSTDLHMSNYPKKSKICYDNAFKPPKMKIDIVSLNLKDLKSKVNVKDDDSCSSWMVSINLSNIKCKPKDNKTKSIVKSDDCM